MPGTYRARAGEKERAKIMKLHEDGLNYEQIAQRFSLSSRTVARIIKREKEHRSA